MLYATSDLSRVEMTEAEARKGLLNFPVNANPNAFRSRGIWPMEGDAPAYDPETEVRTGPTYQAQQQGQIVVRQWQVSDKPLDQVKTERKATLRAIYFTKADAGTLCEVAPETFVAVSTMTRPKVMLENSLSYMTDNEIPSMPVVTTSGDAVSLTPAMATLMIASIQAHVAACEARQNQLVIAINAAVSTAEVMAVDIEAGWPETP